MKRAIMILIFVISYYLAFSQYYDFMIYTEDYYNICFIENDNDLQIHFRPLFDNEGININLKKCKISDSQLGVKVEKSPIRGNSVYIEAGGNAYYYSLNYERRFKLNKENRALFARIGYSNDLAGFNIFPLETSYSFGKKHCFELGGGLVIIREKIKSYTSPPQQPRVQHKIGFTFRAGYRFQGTEGFLFRIAPVIIKELFVPTDLIVWGGLSFGYSF